MKPEIREVPEMKVVGVKGICRNKYSVKDSIPIWMTLMRNKSKIHNIQYQNVAYGISSMIDEDHYWTFAGFQVSDTKKLEPNMQTDIIPKMKIAVFIHQGRIKGLESTYNDIINKWLPQNKLEIDWDKPSVELFDDRFRDTSEMEIWIPIK